MSERYYDKLSNGQNVGLEFNNSTANHQVSDFNRYVDRMTINAIKFLSRVLPAIAPIQATSLASDPSLGGYANWLGLQTYDPTQDYF